MSLTPRAKMLLVMALFAMPIAASFVAYRYFRPQPTANHGELLLPPAQAPRAPLARPGGGTIAFPAYEGRWVLLAFDSGACAERCAAKLLAMRQVRLALGRDAERVVRLFLVDDSAAPEPDALAPFQGTEVAFAPAAGLVSDREHIYLVDPHGNVMMRWPAGGEAKGMLQDLQRLLKASQIG